MERRYNFVTCIENVNCGLKSVCQLELIYAMKVKFQSNHK